MKVFILTEATSTTGFGHLTRCTSIYEAFLEKGITPHFIINSDSSSADLLNNLSHTVLEWQNNPGKLLSLIIPDDVVIIDSYTASLDLYKKIVDKVKLTVYIDDINRLNYPRGLVVNGTVYAEEINYLKDSGKEYLLGSEYAPIRKEFWDVPPKVINEDVISMMITFGGDDIRNLTGSVVEFLQKESPLTHKYVVVGNAFKNKTELLEMSDHSTELLTNLNAQDMLQIMLKADIALSAAGQTLNELACVGVPTVAVQIAENQKRNVHGFNKSGFIEFAGTWESTDFIENLKISIKNIYSYEKRLKKSKIGKKLIDGQGARRIVSEIMKIIS